MDQLPYVEIPWHWFLKEEDRLLLAGSEEEEALVIPALISQEAKDLNQVMFYGETIPKLSSLVADQNFYLEGVSNRNHFKEKIQSVFNQVNANLLADELFHLLEEVYKTPYQEVHSLVFTAYTREQLEDKEVQTVELELNTIGDQLVFDVIPVRMTLNDDNSIRGVFAGEVMEQTNTSTPLTSEAFLQEGVDALVQSTLQSFVEKDVLSLSNESEALDLNLEEASYSHLEDWINHAEGKYKGVVTKVTYTDDKALPHTIYTISVPNTKKVNKYKVIIDRSENQIITIHKEETT